MEHLLGYTYTALQRGLDTVRTRSPGADCTPGSDERRLQVLLQHDEQLDHFAPGPCSGLGIAGQINCPSPRYTTLVLVRRQQCMRALEVDLLLQRLQIVVLALELDQQPLASFNLWGCRC